MEIIKVNGISKNYKNINALKNVSLTINKGELYGLLGVNGAGKTTLIKILTGLCKATSGDAIVDGHPLSEMQEIKKIVDVSPQETAVAGNLTVLENLKFFQELYGTVDKEYLEEILDKIGLSEVRRQRAKTLSGGYQRRLSIAIALMSKPEILFLDEPTLGLDILSSRTILDFMKNERDRGATVLYSTHYMEEAEFLCDRIVMIYKGMIIAQGTPASLKEDTGASNLREVFLKLINDREDKSDE